MQVFVHKNEKFVHFFFMIFAIWDRKEAKKVEFSAERNA